MMTKGELARQAIHLEQTLLKEDVGIQDQICLFIYLQIFIYIGESYSYFLAFNLFLTPFHPNLDVSFHHVPFVFPLLSGIATSDESGVY